MQVPDEAELPEAEPELGVTTARRSRRPTGEFTQTSATTVARISSTPLEALPSVNARSGARIRSIGGGWRVIAP